jgi:hypothetical protein
MIRKALFFLAFLVMCFLVPTVSAHRPDEGNDIGVTLIPDATTSYAYYRQFDRSELVHVYAIEEQAGQFFHAGINIPQIKGLESYQVEFALLGPGLPPLGVDLETSPETHLESELVGHDHNQTSGNIPLPADLKLDRLGGLIVESQESEDFFEPFTQTRYWGRQVLELNLPESGKYYLLVWNSAGDDGKYVLDTGTQEVFSPADILRFPVWWLNTRLYFEQGLGSISVASLLVFGILGIVVYRVHKK